MGVTVVRRYNDDEGNRQTDEVASIEGNPERVVFQTRSGGSAELRVSPNDEVSFYFEGGGPDLGLAILGAQDAARREKDGRVVEPLDDALEGSPQAAVTSESVSEESSEPTETDAEETSAKENSEEDSEARKLSLGGNE